MKKIRLAFTALILGMTLQSLATVLSKIIAKSFSPSTANDARNVQPDKMETPIVRVTKVRIIF